LWFSNSKGGIISKRNILKLNFTKNWIQLTRNCKKFEIYTSNCKWRIHRRNFRKRSTFGSIKINISQTWFWENCKQITKLPKSDRNSSQIKCRNNKTSWVDKRNKRINKIWYIKNRRSNRQTSWRFSRSNGSGRPLAIIRPPESRSIWCRLNPPDVLSIEPGTRQENRISPRKDKMSSFEIKTTNIFY